MREIAGSRILITGASSGIGRALALELARERTKLILNARRAEKLAELAREVVAAGGEAALAVGDVTYPDTRRAALDVAQTRFGGLDVLVNNAGISAHGPFEEAAPDRLRKIMEVNLFALAEMTREAVPLLKQGRQPLIVNIASILGHRGIPYAAEYCASKFAVRGFSESLRAELTPHGIGLLVVSPGTTDTEFFDHLIENRIQMPWAKQTPVPASLVAQRTLRAMRSGRHEIIPNFRGRLLIYLNRLAPRFLDRWMAGYVK